LQPRPIAQHRPCQTLTANKQSITANGKTYPCTGAAVSSYGNFEFDGGYLQISMQAPDLEIDPATPVNRLYQEPVALGAGTRQN
jgi:hypothetical protein